MSEMTGLQLISLLKDRPGLAEIPIVVMSSYADQALIAQARELACVDFLVMPVDRKSASE
jgi:CheY-like chemotaxis protein